MFYFEKSQKLRNFFENFPLFSIQRPRSLRRATRDSNLQYFSPFFCISRHHQQKIKKKKNRRERNSDGDLSIFFSLRLFFNSRSLLIISIHPLFLQLGLLQSWQERSLHEEEQQLQSHGSEQKQSPKGSQMPMLVWAGRARACRYRRSCTPPLRPQETTRSRSQYWEDFQELPTG